MNLDARAIREFLRPIVSDIVRETLQAIQQDEARLGDQLGFPQADAAALLGVEPNVLRDCRLRGELKGRKVGKRIVYSRSELIRFLETEE